MYGEAYTLNEGGFREATAPDFCGNNGIGCRVPQALARLPDPAGLLGDHGLAFGALKRLTELLEVLDGAIHAHSSH
jgi:hypothetical protein